MYTLLRSGNLNYWGYKYKLGQVFLSFGLRFLFRRLSSSVSFL
uniref:Uncharacterized protein n=1 Tax=Manihot esculenta TaxID=3983 RepID=A0A2C9VTD1_MANES